MKRRPDRPAATEPTAVPPKTLNQQKSDFTAEGAPPPAKPTSVPIPPEPKPEPEKAAL